MRQWDSEGVRGATSDKAFICLVRYVLSILLSSISVSVKQLWYII